jgi:signal transduction histidine kinase
MPEMLRRWWSRVLVQKKVWVILLVVFTPLIATLAFHVTLVTELRALQQQRQHAVLAREQLHTLRRLAIDIETAFRGYLLTRQDQFLHPLREAELELPPTIAKALELTEGAPGLAADLRGASERLKALLDSKQALIREVSKGRPDVAIAYVRSGKGIVLSDALRAEFRTIDDLWDRELHRVAVREIELAERAFWGLWLAVVGGLALGLLGARLLGRSIARPLAKLQGSVAGFTGDRTDAETETDVVREGDEIGQLARAYAEMAQRIRRHIEELETLNAIGHDTNTLGPDGLYGVLRRITNHAADLLKVDLCLVMLHNEKVRCWIVEAASGAWHERLQKSVILWEEFPVSVQAFETKQPAIGEDFGGDRSPELLSGSLPRGSMLSVPLLSKGQPFGVLVFIRYGRVPVENWNVRLAKAFGADAAIAIANARLYELAEQRGKGLESRLSQLEHLPEILAHDLKAPGERIEALASLIQTEYGGKLDEQATRWLKLLEQNGRELTQRIHGILEVVRAGTAQDAIEAVDPAGVIQEILKTRSEELTARHVRLYVQDALPTVACHRAYLRQVFDNLISNALKFSADERAPEIRVTAQRKGDRVHFSVSDNGVGIPPEQRQRVFEPFVRLNPAETKGSGIGLAIVKRIVELYDGTVWVEPQQPGCTVTFTLPVLGSLRGDPGQTGATVDPVRIGVPVEEKKAS